MSFIRKRGKVKTMWLPVTTSTTFAKDSLVEFTSGLIAAADAGENAVDIFGIIKKAIVSTDSDYATARLVPIEVPVEKHVEYECTVDGNLVATDIGAVFDLEDASTIDHDATSDAVFKITRYISATKCWAFIKFNGSF